MIDGLLIDSHEHHHILAGHHSDIKLGIQKTQSDRTFIEKNYFLYVGHLGVQIVVV